MVKEMNFGGAIHLNKGAVIAITCGIVFLFVLYHNNASFNQLKDKIQPKYINLREVLSASIDAAKRGGAKVFAVRKEADIHEQLKGKTLEGAKDPVTNGDIFSHFEMVGSLKGAFPNVKIISEEKPKNEHDSSNIAPANKDIGELSRHKMLNQFVKLDDLQIWIDPLDATHEYTENLLQYVTTMVCVAHKGVPVIGVIHKPFQNTTDWSWLSQAHSEGLEVPKDTQKPDENTRVIVSRSHKGQVEVVAEEAFKGKATITEAAGAGYKSLEVLSGRQDVYVHTTKIKLWDICAGDALLKYFGGYMTTISGNRFNYGEGADPNNFDGVIAALYNHKRYLEKFRKLKEVPHDLAHLAANG